MTQDLRPLFEDPSAPPALRNFVALARGDGPSQADLDRLALRVGRTVGVSAGVLLAGSAASATALGTPPMELAAALTPGVTGKLGVFSKLFATAGGKLLAVGLSAGIGVGVWAYTRQPAPALREQMAQAPAPAPREETVAQPIAPPAAVLGGAALPAPAPRATSVEEPGAPVPVVTALPANRARAARAVAPSRAASRPTRRAPLSAPVKEAPAAVEPGAPAAPEVQLPSELSLIQQAEAARQRGLEALKLLATHERLYPRGALAQEREVLAIELLLKLGKPPQAQERAARFARDYPSSAHLPRVRALVERARDE